MKIWGISIVLVSLLGLVLSWDEAGISKCAKGCVKSGLRSECSRFNNDQDGCICKSSQLYSFVACCVVMKCQEADWKAADTLVNNTCADPTVELITDLEACKPSSGSVTIPTYPSYTDPSEESPKKDNESSRVKIVIATVVPILVLALFLVLCIFYVRRRRSRALIKETLPPSETKLNPSIDEDTMYSKPYSVDEYPALVDSRMIRHPSPAQLRAVPIRQSITSSVTTIKTK